MNQSKYAVAFLLAFASGAASAQWSGHLGVGAKQMRMTEYNAAGRPIISEDGWLPGLEAGVAYRFGRLQLFGRASHYRSDIDYRGRTQRGVAFETDTGTELSGIAAGMRVTLMEVWSAGAALEYDRWERIIEGRSGVSGLKEKTSSRRIAVNLARQWQSTYGLLTTSIGAVRSEPERLRVDFDGAFDPASLKTESATGYRLGLAWQPASLQGFVLRADYDKMRIGQSDPFAARRNGTVAGAVSQPEHVRRHLTLSVAYSF